MSKCPKCHEEVDQLRAVVEETNLYSFDGGDYEFDERLDFNATRFKCPECLEMLFRDEEDARVFLTKEVSDVQS